MSSKSVSLVIAAAQGDRDAFGELYEMYYKEMYAYALSMVHEEESAKDAVSDAVLDAFRQLPSLRQPESFKGWLFKILNAACKRYYIRNAKSGDMVRLDDDEGTFCDIPVSQDMDLTIDMKNALAALSPQEREIVILSVVEDYKSYEIAEMMGLNASTVRSKLKRALKKCRDCFEKN